MSKQFPVIFLDFDGVVLAFQQSSDQKINWDNREKVVFDKTAVDLLNKLLTEFNAKLVLSTSWSKGDKNSCIRILKNNNIDPNLLHENWTTPKKMSSSRYLEIKLWLEDQQEDGHKQEKWLALDDDYTVSRFEDVNRVEIKQIDDNSLFNEQYYNEARTKLIKQKCKSHAK